MDYGITILILGIETGRATQLALTHATFPYVHDIEWYQPVREHPRAPAPLQALQGYGEVKLGHMEREHEVNLQVFLTLVVAAIRTVVGEAPPIRCEINRQVWVLHGVYDFGATSDAEQ